MIVTHKETTNWTSFGQHSAMLVVVPAFNEQATVFAVVDELKSNGYEVLVVDDGSTDSTTHCAISAGAAVLSLPLNVGVGGALRAGFRYAVDKGYKRVVQIDGDGQHPIDQIPDLVHAADLYRADLVIGSRYLSESSTLSPSAPRRFVMWLLSAIATRLSGASLTDTTSGFRLISEPLLSEFAQQFPSYYLGDTYQATISAIRANYRIIEIPASLSKRKHGRSSARTIQASTQIAKVIVLTLGNLAPRLRNRQTVTSTDSPELT